MPYIFTPAQRPSLTIVGESELTFPLHRIYCVGQNYAAHAKEMGNDPQKSPPFFFGKPADCATHQRHIPYPTQTENLHHEVELVVALKEGGQNLSPEAAKNCIFGYGVGFDLTRRDLQTMAKKSGKPWDMAKGFDVSAPISPLRKASEIGHPTEGTISCHVNTELRQSGDLSDMIWSVPEQISYLSKFVALQAGDLIFTGTPEGVSAISIGDTVTASIEGIGDHAIVITAQD